MNIDIHKSYKTTVEILGICPKGTRVKPANQDGELKMGVSGETCMFNLTNGGGVYLKDTEVEVG